MAFRTLTTDSVAEVVAATAAQEAEIGVRLDIFR